jgi:post-segregation antitoxin (ccd killing protein)
MKLKAITISITEDIFHELKDLKLNHHINISSFVQLAIKEKLEKENQLKPIEIDYKR